MSGWWWPVALLVAAEAAAAGALCRSRWRAFRAGADRVLDEKEHQDEALALFIDDQTDDEPPLDVDPAPTLREETIQPSSTTPPSDEHATWVTVGTHRVHITCRDARTNGRADEVCAGCAPWLVGPAAGLRRRTQ